MCCGDLTALVSETDVTKPLGTPEDLQAHQEILDAVVAKAPVLPFRFGGDLASADAVVEELLEPNHDEFAAALRQLEGCAQYIVRGRYDEQAILEEHVVADLSDRWLGRVELTVRGPLAPYDFVGGMQEAGG